MIRLALLSLAGWGVWRWRHHLLKGPAYIPAAKGDTMGAIAARFGTTPDAIVAANGPGFARFYAPDGSPVSFKLPSGLKDGGTREGAMGRFVS